MALPFRPFSLCIELVMFQIPVSITVCILGSIDTESVVAVKGEGTPLGPTSLPPRGHWIRPQAPGTAILLPSSYLDTLLV